MTTFKKISLLVISLILMSGAAFYIGANSKEIVKTVDDDAVEELRKIKEQEEKKIIMGQFVLDLMQEVNSQLSQLKRQILARIIASVVIDIFDREDHQKAFITVVAIESGFNKFAQSPTGPKGMSQMAKAAFKEGMEMCAVAKYEESDVWDETINVLSGACYFKKILERTKGDVFAAIVAYNQGMSSEAFKNYQKSGRMKNEEALNYMSRFVYLAKPVIADTKTPTDNVKGKVK